MRDIDFSNSFSFCLKDYSNFAFLSYSFPKIIDDPVIRSYVYSTTLGAKNRSAGDGFSAHMRQGAKQTPILCTVILFFDSAGNIFYVRKLIRNIRVRKFSLGRAAIVCAKNSTVGFFDINIL